MLALLTNLSGKADFQDSLQSVQDTVAVASDSTGTVAGAGEEMGRAVDLLASGDIYSFSQQMKVIFINFVDNVLPEFITAFLVFVLLYGVYRVVRALLARVLKASRHVDAGLES